MTHMGSACPSATLRVFDASTALSVSEAVRVGVGDDDAGGRVNPLVIIVDAGDGAGGADDSGGRDGHFADALDDAFHCKTEIQAAFGEEAGGVGVTIDCGEAAEMVALDEVAGIAPVEEIELDGGTVGVVADGAFDGMTP
ncbi:MAG TPA: hypothetical protein VGR72_05910 [Candidatus Acidoferrales bacterium]|nr:hypothetical protein [Candidatus Acidoferrales bacterium]